MKPAGSPSNAAKSAGGFAGIAMPRQQMIRAIKLALTRFLVAIEALMNRKQNNGIANSLGIDVQDEIEKIVESQQMAANTALFKLQPICRARIKIEIPATSRKIEIDKRSANTGSKMKWLIGQSIQPIGKKASEPPENKNLGSLGLSLYN
jgi:hypothetical protein